MYKNVLKFLWLSRILSFSVFTVGWVLACRDCRCSPNFRATFSATRDIDLCPPLFPRIFCKPNDEHGQMRDDGQQPTIVWSMSSSRGFSSRRPRLQTCRGCPFAIILHATFKGPDLKSSAYTRSAWLAVAAACSAL